MEWSSGEVKSRIVEALLEDVSAVGACVQVEDRVPLGIPVTISMGDVRFGGHVSYCVFRDYGYFVGIRFAEDTEWSSGLFKPRHLTNLQELGYEPAARQPGELIVQ
jgi:hypothetical protein